MAQAARPALLTRVSLVTEAAPPAGVEVWIR